MLKRIFMTIQRGMTDQTAVCVFPWEKPIIEEIHKSGATEVSIDEMCSKEGVKSIKPIKLKARVDADGKEMIPEPGLDLRARLIAMTAVSEEDDPTDNPSGEYGRMIEKYGMHPELPMPAVEKVYGNDRNFRMCVRDFAKGRMPAFLAEDSDDDIDEPSIAEMSIQQLRSTLKQKDIPFKKTDTTEQLRDLLLETA